MKKNQYANEYLFAFTETIPILLGYIFLGIAFGLMLQDAGYNFIWAFFMLVTLLAGAQSLINTFVMTLFINGRHLFYGLSFIEKFREMGKAFPYMAFSLTDETYSVLCSLKVPEGLNEKKISFLISLFDHIYWITGSLLGALIGQWLSFYSTGVDFSMTALFVVIVVNQWLENKKHFSTLTGFLTALLALALLGPDSFLLPALACSTILLIVFRKQADDKPREEEEAKA